MNIEKNMTCNEIIELSKFIEELKAIDESFNDLKLSEAKELKTMLEVLEIPLNPEEIANKKIEIKSLLNDYLEFNQIIEEIYEDLNSLKEAYLKEKEKESEREWQQLKAEHVDEFLEFYIGCDILNHVKTLESSMIYNKENKEISFCLVSKNNFKVERFSHKTSIIENNEKEEILSLLLDFILFATDNSNDKNTFNAFKAFKHATGVIY